MKLYELTQQDLEVLTSKYRALTNDPRFVTPQVFEVVEDLLGDKRMSSWRQIFGDLPNSKLNLELEMNGDINCYLFLNQLRDTERLTAIKNEFDTFAKQYLESKTKRGLWWFRE